MSRPHPRPEDPPPSVLVWSNDAMTLEHGINLGAFEVEVCTGEDTKHIFRLQELGFRSGFKLRVYEEV